ncbi:DNA-processing protein DprA [Caldanaerobius polysaccharolyticus]|uniref:DNA-processing protein DprA n=1 Tax=Caldanaerobius polysaccharolyticus TaxID=44256 RepID=UPI00068C5690|nr:DNA-processing protein DprA [Caldanaerobius polysaccharolyticus]
MEEGKYVLLLSLCRGIGSRRFFTLMDHFKTAFNVFKASPSELLEVPGISGELCNNIIKSRDYDIDFYIKKMRSKGIDYVTFYDDSYPELLRHIYDPPPVLFYAGDLSIDSIAIAVVGSRKPSYYGLKAADRIARDLAVSGITVVSGMARGIDGAAQRAAIDAGGKTVAVLGCGVDVVYPPENRDLYEKIREKGLVVSEYPPGTQPVAGYFPQRNRIISGLSRGVVVVEAGEKSGSLITAQAALEQGRDVFAVPGNIFSPMSAGCHRLIKDGAKLVTSAQDILEEYQWGIHAGPEREHQGTGDLSAEETKVYELIKLSETIHIDDLVAVAGIPVEKVNSILTLLELKGKVKRLPGKIYEVL